MLEVIAHVSFGGIVVVTVNVNVNMNIDPNGDFGVHVVGNVNGDAAVVAHNRVTSDC